MEKIKLLQLCEMDIEGISPMASFPLVLLCYQTNVIKPVSQSIPLTDLALHHQAVENNPSVTHIGHM